MRSRTTARAGTAVLAVLAAAAVVVLPAARATAATPDPAANIVPSFPSSCASAPTGQVCEDGVVAELDHAHAVMGLPAYALPASFDVLAPAAQLVVLSNLDRAAYGLAPADGLNPTLDAAAQTAATQRRDPTGPGTVDGVGFRGWAANVAGGYSSALEAYFSWMYDDGPGSPNSDCVHAGDAGCWGHRHDTLVASGSLPLSMGVGAAVVGGVPYFTELYWYAASPVSALPVVTGASPASGGPGTVVTITGYGLDGATAVGFGAASVPPVASSATALRVTAPAGSGAVGLLVTGHPSAAGVAGSASAPTAAAAFSFLPAGRVPGRSLARVPGTTGAAVPAAVVAPVAVSSAPPVTGRAVVAAAPDQAPAPAAPAAQGGKPVAASPAAQGSTPLAALLGRLGRGIDGAA